MNKHYKTPQEFLTLYYAARITDAEEHVVKLQKGEFQTEWVTPLITRDLFSRIRMPGDSSLEPIEEPKAEEPYQPSPMVLQFIEDAKATVAERIQDLQDYVDGKLIPDFNLQLFARLATITYSDFTPEGYCPDFTNDYVSIMTWAKWLCEHFEDEGLTIAVKDFLWPVVTVTVNADSIARRKRVVKSSAAIWERPGMPPDEYRGDEDIPLLITLALIQAYDLGMWSALNEYE